MQLQQKLRSGLGDQILPDLKQHDLMLFKKGSLQLWITILQRISQKDIFWQPKKE